MHDIVASFYQNLRKTQYLPPERMRQYQRSLLEPLIRHARQHVPFYRDTGRLDVLFKSDDAIDWDRWMEVPPLTRAEAQEHQESLFAETYPLQLGEMVEQNTGGNSGTPLRSRTTDAEVQGRMACLWRAASWYGVGVPNRIMIIRNPLNNNRLAPPIFAVRPGIWQTSFMNRVFVAIDLDLNEQQRAIEEFRPSWIVTYASHMANLAENFSRDLFDGIETLIVTGELVSEHAREIIRKKYNGPLLEAYASTESGPIATSAPGGGYLVCDEMVLLDHDGVPEGDPPGYQTTVTPLYGFPMPLIRYQPGDYFMRPEIQRDHGGIGLQQIERVLGRSKCLFLLPDGRRVFPTLGSATIADVMPYRQFQFVQEKRDAAVLRIIPKGQVPYDAAEQLRTKLEPRYAGQIRIRVEFVDELPQTGPKAAPPIYSMVT